VVDDGSNDDTCAVATAAGAKVLRQPNRGPAAARNLGAWASTGDIMLFTDADCAPIPCWVSNMVAHFTDPAVVGVRGVYRTRQRGLMARFVQAEFEERYRLQSRRATIDFVDTSSAAFRRSSFIAAGGFDERFPNPNNEDVEFSYRLASQGALLVFAPEGAVYHHHPDTLADYLRVKFGRGYWRTVVYRLYPAKALADSYTPQVLKLQVVLVGFVIAGFVPALLLETVRYAVVGCIAALLASTLPFTAFVARRDPAVALLAPPLLLLRALALGAGTAAALLGRGRGLAAVPAARANLDRQRSSEPGRAGE